MLWCKLGDSRIRVSVEAQEINFRLRSAGRMTIYRGLFEGTLRVQRETWTVGIFVGVEQNVRSVILVVTDSISEGRRSGHRGNTLSGAPVWLQLKNIATSALLQVESRAFLSHCVGE